MIDDFYIRVAELFATRGTCPRLQVGAVAIKDRRVLATGYNGAPSGAPHCGCVIDEANHCINAVHAELNLIANAARHGVCLIGCTVYCTHEPCNKCLPVLINAGVENVIYKNTYKNQEAILGHREVIQVTQISDMTESHV